MYLPRESVGKQAKRLKQAELFGRRRFVFDRTPRFIDLLDQREHPLEVFFHHRAQVGVAQRGGRMKNGIVNAAIGALGLPVMALAFRFGDSGWTARAILHNPAAAFPGFCRPG